MPRSPSDYLHWCQSDGGPTAARWRSQRFPQWLAVHGMEVWTGDLAYAEACRDAVGSCVSRLGRIDILVNSAAVTGPPAIAPLLETTDVQLDRVVDVNLKAPFRCAREAARWKGAG